MKDQGPNCSSSWAFAAAGNIEGLWAIATATNAGTETENEESREQEASPAVSLSAQHLLSCEEYHGCDGSGRVDDAFYFLSYHAGGWIATEDSYPYTSGADGALGECRDRSEFTRGARIVGMRGVARNETKMAAFVAEEGPLPVVVEGLEALQHYRGGVVTDCVAGTAAAKNGKEHGRSPQHSGLIVGYDDVSEPPYWIIKNSWGADWGEGGFVRIAKGTNACKITSFPYTAEVV